MKSLKLFIFTSHLNGLTQEPYHSERSEESPLFLENLRFVQYDMTPLFFILCKSYLKL